MSSALHWLASSSGMFQDGTLLTLFRLTLLLAFAWFCNWSWIRCNPHLRVLLWRATAAGLILILGLGVLPYRVQIPLLPAVSRISERTDAEVESRFESIQHSLPRRRPTAVSPAPVQPSPQASSLETVESRAATIPRELPSRLAAADGTMRSSMITWLAILWAIGAIVISTPWFIGINRLASRYRQANEAPADVLTQARAIAASLGYQGPIEVRHSRDVQSPLSIGMWRIRILIPTLQCEPLQRQELRATLAHELAHCAGRDLPWNHLLVLLHTCLWFHPLAWRIRLAHADACDEVCDAKAAALLGDKTLYGRLLARIALRIAKGQSAAALAMARRSQVRKRIEAVGRNTANMRLAPWQSSGVVVVAAIAAIILGTVTVGRSVAEPPAARPPVVRPALSGTSEPGASVKLYFYSDTQAEPALIHEATVDSKGQFAFDELPTLGERAMVVAVATKPGFATAFRGIRSTGPSELDLPMKSTTASLSGTITDQNGIPIAGAVVTTQPYRYRIPGVLSAASDDKGRFSIDDLAPWSVEGARTVDAKTGVSFMTTHCYVWITHPNYPLTKAAYTSIPQQLDIQLFPPAIVEGSVVDLVTGDSLPGVEVQAQGIAEGGWHTATSDAKGHYQLRMTTDHYNIWAVAPDRMPLAIKALQATQGQRLVGMDIRMARGGYVVGKVIDSTTNRPVDGVQTDLQVAHYGPARPKTGAAVTSARVEADGAFRLHVAPGRNYIYLMNGSGASAYVEVGEGQTVEQDLIVGSATAESYADDPDELLGRQIREDAQRAQKQGRKSSPSTPHSATQRSNTEVGKLLTQLEDMNTGPDQFQDAWANQIRKIAKLGPEAVPELVDELDRTSSGMMLSSVAFILRAIDDKRAVPALIRTIPKTLRPSGSDMGLQIRGTDQTLLQFMQQHDLHTRSEGAQYGFGRPVREVFGALKSLTGESFGEEELYSIFIDENDFASQQRAKRELFHEMARRWATWWRQHGRELIDDADSYVVELPPLPEAVAADALAPETPLKTGSGASGWLLESARRSPGGRAFYDLDTGRAASLPQRWRDLEWNDETLEQIKAWAAENGFDMMGDEITGQDDQAVFVLRPLGLRAWELPETRWKDAIERTSMASLQAEGRPNGADLLVHVDAESNEVVPTETATFFFITREGTPGVLYVGVQVHDDSLRPGTISNGDDELSPVAFTKGRRFGRSRLVLAD